MKMQLIDKSLVVEKRRYSLGIVSLAVDRVVLDEAGGLSVEGELTDAAAQAVGVPRASGHLQ